MNATGRFLIATSMLAVFAAPATASGVSAATRPNLLHPAQPVIYGVASSNPYQGVFVYNADDGKLIGALETPNQRTVSNEQTAVDGNGVVYVGASYGTVSNPKVQIQAYAPGSSEPSRILRGGNGYLNAMAAAANGEIVAVRYPGGTNLDFFAPGATSPTRTISTQFDYVGTAAYEPDGTLWLHGYAPGSSDTFGYVPPGGARVTLVKFTGAPARGPIAIDGAGNIVTEAYGVVKAYSPSGTLVYTFLLGLRPGNISAMAFSADHKLLYVADAALQILVYRVQKSSSPLAAFGRHSSNLAVGSM